jgi:hypothetical protein
MALIIKTEHTWLLARRSPRFHHPLDVHASAFACNEYLKDD